MTGKVPREIPGLTVPLWQEEAQKLAADLARYAPEELITMLRCNRQIALENWHRYRDFGSPDTLCPAVFSYDGMVFQRLAPETMSDAELAYANDHLLIGSFLYGLLRPLDKVNPYRLEGDVSLPVADHLSMFDYWKPRLTDYLIQRVKADDGVLVNLASAEFKRLFDWRRVAKSVTVVTPDFKVEEAGREKNVTIYAKMCRGAMTRWILLNHPFIPVELTAFEYEGFHHVQNFKFVCHA